DGIRDFHVTGVQTCALPIFFPRDLAPRIGDLLANHRLDDAIRVRGVAVRKTAFHAGVALIRSSVAIRHHAHDGFVLDLRDQRATNAAVTTCRRDATLWSSHGDDRLLGQRSGRAGFDARTAGDAFGLEEGLVLACGNLRIEAPSLDR